MSSERNTGRTRAMVEAIPEAGGVIIVHTAALNDYVKRMVVDLRNEKIAKAVRVVSVRSWSDCFRLQGLRCYVAVDHAVWETARPEVAEKLRELLYGIELARKVA